MCFWFFHNWDKWKPRKIDMLDYRFVIRYTRNAQVRYCKTCNKQEVDNE